jgi:hypothetical protein
MPRICECCGEEVATQEELEDQARGITEPDKPKAKPKKGLTLKERPHDWDGE